jgi:hypothetical protein
MTAVVTLEEIERVFDILAELGLSREAVVIPLKPAQPGRVQLRPDHRIEIVFDGSLPLEAWLEVVRQRLHEIMAGPAGARLKRAES